MDHKEEFLRRFREAQENGVGDVKFFVPDGHAMTEKDLFKASNAFDAAAENKIPMDLEDWDRKLERLSAETIENNILQDN